MSPVADGNLCPELWLEQKGTHWCTASYNRFKSDWADERWRWRQSLVVFLFFFITSKTTLCTLSDCSLDPLSRLVTSLTSLLLLFSVLVSTLLPLSGHHRYCTVKDPMCWCYLKRCLIFREKHEKSEHWNLSWTTTWAAWHQVCHPAGEDRRKMFCLHKLTLLPGK